MMCQDSCWYEIVVGLYALRTDYKNGAALYREALRQKKEIGGDTQANLKEWRQTRLSALFLYTG